jgi:hypothetical protein
MDYYNIGQDLHDLARKLGSPLIRGFEQKNRERNRTVYERRKRRKSRANLLLLLVWW